MAHTLSELVDKYRPNLEPYHDIYRTLHAAPELSFQESKTAAFAAAHLQGLSPVFDIRTGIGGHGLVGILRNGTGRTVLLRADMDGLPVLEATGLPYASTARQFDSDGVEKPVMHACGHDMHVTSMLAAAELLVAAKDSWKGTLIVLFQPAEERGAGAQAMVNDGLYTSHGVPKPDVVLGGHIMPLRTGTLGTRRGLMASAADSMRVTLFGRGGHASQPHRTLDPVVMAASAVLRLQTIVSREVPPEEPAVVTVASLIAGQTENIISDKAELKLDVRSSSAETREKVLRSVDRIIRAEAMASGADKEPVFEKTRSFPLTINDDVVTAALEAQFSSHFGDEYNSTHDRMYASEDFSILGTAIERPCCFWVYGGVDVARWDAAQKAGRIAEDIPSNHSAFFAPVIEPTLTTAVDALALGALTFLA
ncbi:metal-dependent amidase/aminoacylase/carboxypeptidase [Exidia glandulosa HHB12029]|uniref:Metal-dependent amidase/aminoacylase/carboxypeptidase n=1 Tax=Exidia glandulosa HHB12029 TaxID=1314781 RepID=A0A165M0Z3_EXIGL|nr:metal-dependent amidase/aminoacylase/carboxypeptidase [Exidia glandulosa HHB12029]